MCRDCGWEDFIDKIDEMLDDPKYDKAEKTLTGIRDRVEDTEHATDAQSRAVDNIESGFNH